LKPTVLVTGASGGIGEAICRLLVAKQYKVAGTARKLSSLDKLGNELGDSFHALELDVRDADAVKNIMPSLSNEFKQIDVLINNAGHDVGGRRHFTEGSVDQWCDIIETNVQGLIRVSHALAQSMLERGKGHIVNLGSIAGLKPYATGSAYVASKYAVHGLSDSLRLEYANKGIRVTEIMPGLVRTGFAEQRLGDVDQAAEFYDSFEQCLDPKDVAETVLFALQQPKHVEIAQLVILPVS